MNLNEKDTLLAFKIGLCHDLGRFYEVEKLGRFNNVIFDHGTYSNKILYNDLFVNYMDINEHLLFRKAIYYHNKRDLGNDLNNREYLFANMIRDIDKLDILAMRSTGKILTFKDDPTEVVLNNYMNNQTIDIKDIHNRTDSILLYLSFIKDLVFDASFDLAIDGKYLDTFLTVVEGYEEKEELLNQVKEKLNERRGKVYVR